VTESSSQAMPPFRLSALLGSLHLALLTVASGNRSELARRIGARPQQIDRWLSTSRKNAFLTPVPFEIGERLLALSGRHRRSLTDPFLPPGTKRRPWRDELRFLMVRR
jgi:hypothetical protein